MHPGGEDEGGDVIGEISNHGENITEMRHEISNHGNHHNLEDSPENIDGVGDEYLSLGDLSPVSLDHFVDRLHPERESADDGDDHEKVDGIGNPGTVRQRLDNVIHHTVSWM